MKKIKFNVEFQYGHGVELIKEFKTMMTILQARYLKKGINDKNFWSDLDIESINNENFLLNNDKNFLYEIPYICLKYLYKLMIRLYVKSENLGFVIIESEINETDNIIRDDYSKLLKDNGYYQEDSIYEDNPSIQKYLGTTGKKIFENKDEIFEMRQESQNSINNEDSDNIRVVSKENNSQALLNCSEQMFKSEKEIFSIKSLQEKDIKESISENFVVGQTIQFDNSYENEDLSPYDVFRDINDTDENENFASDEINKTDKPISVVYENQNNNEQKNHKNKEKKHYKVMPFMVIIGIAVASLLYILFLFVLPNLGDNVNKLNLIECIYHIISFGFYLFAFYVPFKLFGRFKQFVNAEPEQRQTFSEKIWKAYHDTFFNSDYGLTNKTRANADLYFNIDSVFTSISHKYSWFQSFKVISGAFIGIGILGTFIGFSSGIQSLDLRDTSSMLSEIPMFLDGLKTAFNTSIVGVFSSLIYTFMVYTPLVQRMNNYFEELCDELDKEFYVSETEAIMRYSMVTTVDGTPVRFSDSLRIIIENMNKQTSALDNFSSDLADKIANIDKTVNNGMQSIAENTGSVLAEAIKDEINTHVAGLKEALVSASENLMLTADSLTNVIDRINGEVGEKITEVDNALVKSLENSKNVAETLSDLPVKISAVSSGFDVASRNLASVSDIVTQNMADLHEGYNNILTDLRKTESTVQELIVSSKLNEETSGRNLATVLEKTNAVLEGFRKVDNNLNHIFEQLSNGLRSYTEQTKGTLDQYLSSFAESSKDFAGTMHGSVFEYGETVESLHETVSNLQTQLTNMQNTFMRFSQDFDESLNKLIKAISKDNK
ncbi:MAG: hypothetical protein IKQ61_00515 [Spirochaetales bacterium]|nr:hypothetical protein [Spirochaetales bacterium]